MFSKIYCKKKIKKLEYFRTEIDFIKRFFSVDGYTKELQENEFLIFFPPAV